MKLEKYKKYRKYNLMGISFIILIYLLSEEKNDFYYTISISMIFLIMSLGAWLEILIKKEQSLEITTRDKFHLLFPMIVGIPLVLDLLVKFFQGFK